MPTDRSDPGSDALVAQDLRVSLGGQPILAGVDLRVASGSTLSVLGPSGCGKTTLLRALAGLVPIESGRVLVGGRDVTATSAHRRGMGLVFQDLALFPHRDVAANVAFGLRMAGVGATDRRRRVDELLGLVGLEGYGRRRVDELSGGEAQRVALARALAPRPAVLLLDEPFAALDRSLHDRLVDELPSLLGRAEVTVVHVTHDRTEALALADQLVVMGRGDVLQRGAPAQVWSQPNSEAVARFLGLDAIATAEVRRGRLVVDGVEVVAGLDKPDGTYRLLVPPTAVRVLGLDDELKIPWPRVERVRFAGASTEVVLGLAPELHVALAVSADVALHAGDQVTVRVDPARLVLWDGAAETGQPAGA